MTWLINIARNQALDARRRPEIRQAALEEQLSEDEYGPEFAIDPEPEAGGAFEISRLNDCVHGLGEEQRGALLLSYIDGFTPSEIAARLTRPVATVKTWLRRALLQLRTCMS